MWRKCFSFMAVTHFRKLLLLVAALLTPMQNGAQASSVGQQPLESANSGNTKLALRLTDFLSSKQSAAEPGLVAQQPPEPANRGNTKPALRLVIPPIRWWGSVSYDLREEFADEGNILSQSMMGQVNASTYIWAPWLAQISGGLGLSFNTVEADRQQDGTVVTGNIRLNLFPVSRFPFETYFDFNDSRQDGVVVSEQFTTTRYGIKQGYSPVNGNTRYFFGYDHTTQTRAKTGDDNFDALQLEMSTQLKSHSFQVNGRLTENSSADGTLDSNYRSLVGKHTWRPSSRFSLENLANVTYTESDAGTSPLESTFLQLTSQGIWRDQTDKWLVTGGVRMFGFSTAINATEAEIRSLNLNLGANYQYSSAMRLFGNFNATQTEGSATSGLTTSQTLGASYQPTPLPFGSWSYVWGASGSASNRMGETDSGQHLSTQLNHGLNRTYSLTDRSSASLNLSQNLSSEVDTSAESILRISHAASAGWSLTEGSALTLVRLSLSDSRSLAGLSQTFQLLNLQMSRNQQISNRSGLTGNLTWQATQQESDTGVVTQNMSGGGDLIYQHQRAFNIPRLRYTSDFRLSLSENKMQNIGELMPNTRAQENMSWENRFDYLIGRTNLSLSLRASRVDGKERELLMFRVTRLFGAY